MNVTFDLGQYRVVKVDVRGIVLQIGLNVHIVIDPQHYGIDNMEVAEGDTLTLYTKIPVKAPQ